MTGLALLLLLPAAAMAMVVSHAGRRWLDHIVRRADAAAILPGITLEHAAPHAVGLIITSTRSQGEAAHRGLAVGDRITAIDGHPIFSLDQARHYLQKDRARTVQLRVVRAARSRDVRLGRDGGYGGPQAAGDRGR